MLRPYKIVTQTDSVEVGDPHTHADDWMDDCAWASMASIKNFLSGTKFTSKDGIAWGEKVGRHDRDGQPDPSSLAQLAAAARLPEVALHARYPKSWDEVVAALNAGAALAVNVEQARGYPTTVRMSKFHQANQKKHPGFHYGHCTAASLGFWADPTMSGKGDEEWAVPVTIDELKQIASSKGDAPHQRIVIFTAPATATAPSAPAATVKTPEPVKVAPKTAVARNEMGAQPEVDKKPATPLDPAVQAELDHLAKEDWGAIGASALHTIEDAVQAAGKERTTMAKVSAFLKYVKDNTGIDEALIEFVRTFVTVSISVALGLGIPLLDISGGDFRTVLSAGLASGLQVLVKFLDPKQSAFGIKESK